MIKTWYVQVCNLEYLKDYSNIKSHATCEEKCDNKEKDLNWAHPFPRVVGYKKGNNNIMCDIPQWYFN